ncbi:hypothetical protein MBANPS3_011172 [Mucor bainieri]
MNEAARVILTKLTLVDPTTSSFSAYQQSAESSDSTVLEANRVIHPNYTYSDFQQFFHHKSV